MIVLQIIYLIVNLIGFTFGLVYLVSSLHFSFISNFFTFVSRRLGNVILALTSLVTILLFMPAITVMAAIISFIVLFNTYSK